MKPFLPALFLLLSASMAWAAPAASRLDELDRLLRHDCGSCHGLTLKGGLGPPLTREALVDKDAAMLEETIVHGRPGSAMPPWGALLSREEIQWMVERLKEGATP